MTTTTTPGTTPPMTGAIWRAFFDQAHQWLGRLCARLALADTVARERNALGSLDERLLSDIGVNRASAAQESRRAYWDLPADRLDD